MQITTTQHRVDAVPFATVVDAHAAVMQYCGEIENLPAGAFSVRGRYSGSTFPVLVDIGDSCFRWVGRRRKVA